MRKTKKLMSGIIAMGMAIALSIPVFADEVVPMSAVDSDFPTPFIGYTSSKSYNTGTRSKDNTTYNYVLNTSGFDLWVITRAGRDKSNQTKNGHAIVKSGEWFIANYVREKGYTSCFLNITTATSGTSGYLRGKCSPDSVGSCPVANR